MFLYKIKLCIARLRCRFHCGAFDNNIYYINGSETLPPPLCAEEEDRMIRDIENEESRACLIEHNLRLVAYIAKRFENTGANIEELISIGTVGLVKAIASFNTEKNIKLATYASRCIENEILMFIRKSQTHKRELSIDEPLSVDWDGNELLLSDVLGSDSDIVTKDMEDDEAQEGYGTMIHDQFTVFAVPASAAKDKLDMIGAALEVMASESQRLVKPAYYEIALKRKYMSDPEAWEMLDLIFSVVRIDAAVTYVVPMDCPHHNMRNIVASKKNTVSSKCAKLGKNLDRYLTKVHKKLEKLAE